MNEKIVLVLLILLALSNLIFLLVSSYPGPIVGCVVATVAAIVWWRKRDCVLIVVVAIIWIIFHIYELMTIGPSSQPVLFFMNLLLPVLLLFFGLKEKRK